jgi:hypothetical protein
VLLLLALRCQPADLCRSFKYFVPNQWLSTPPVKFDARDYYVLHRVFSAEVMLLLLDKLKTQVHVV